MQNTLLIELRTEELPPKALPKLAAAFADTIVQELQKSGLLANATPLYQTFATPRRLAVSVADVLAVQPDQTLERKGPAVAAGFKDGQPSPALLGFAKSCGVAVEALQQGHDGKQDCFLFKSTQVGQPLAAHITTVLQTAVKKLPSPKLMRWGSADAQFVRPVHGLVVLHGTALIPAQILGLSSGRTTLGHRFIAPKAEITLLNADDYAAQLADEGKVIASFAQRKAMIAEQIAQQAAACGAQAIEDAALLDEVTALVEYPTVYIGSFEETFLSVPQECLILTMKQNQKYFPLLDAQGKLRNQFLIVSNIQPQDPINVIEGNARVVRPRLADAKFFFEQDRKHTLASRIPKLANVVYHNQLGTQAERSERVRQLCHLIVAHWSDHLATYSTDIKDKMEMLAHKADEAARLAKTDLLTDMVGEFPELQGTMGCYYARFEGLREGVALAIEDHYKPRFAGDSLPRNNTGTVLAIADKLETLIGMFGIGNTPTGDKDPFGLRRHALGVIRLIIENQLPFNVPLLIKEAQSVFGNLLTQTETAHTALITFIYERLAGLLREQGYTAQEVDAVISRQPAQLAQIPAKLAAVRHFSQMEEAQALAAANKRISNILKKAEQVGDTVEPSLLQDPAEQALFSILQTLSPQVQALSAAGDYADALQALASVRTPVDDFFAAVMVNTENVALKSNRLALLGQLQQLLNQVADISKLAV